MTDQQALQRYARHGDMEAFHTLVETYQRLVYAACRRHLRDEADIEDAAQETFLKLAEQAGGIRRNVAGWLHRSATNASIDRVRREATRRRHELAWVPSDNADSEPWQDIMAEVDAALDELDDEDRELIMGYYLDGETQSRIAEQQGMSRSGLQHRIGRAVDRLRVVLKRRGVIAPAASLTAFFIQDAAHAQIPGALSNGLMKLGLSGAGSGGGATMGGGTLAWIGAAAASAVVVVVAVIVFSTGNPLPNTTANTPAPIGVTDDKASDLHDPAFDRPLQPVAVNGSDQLEVEFQNTQMIVYSKKDDVSWVYEVTGGNPAAVPAEIDIQLVGIEGDGWVSDEEMANIGETRYAVYQLFNKNHSLLIVASPFDGERPQNIPKTLMGNTDNYILTQARMPGTVAENKQDHKDILDPWLAGPWTPADQYFLVPHKEFWDIYEITNPDGNPVGKFTVNFWETKYNPKQLGGLVTIATPDGEFNVEKKMIYATDENGGPIRAAEFSDTSPFADEYPTGFEDQREGFQSWLFVEYQP